MTPNDEFENYDREELQKKMNEAGQEAIEVNEEYMQKLTAWVAEVYDFFFSLNEIFSEKVYAITEEARELGLLEIVDDEPDDDAPRIS